MSARAWVHVWTWSVLAGVAYFVLRTPLPVHDNLIEIQRVADGSFWPLVRDSVIADGYFRPGMRAMLWAVYQVGPDRYVAAYRVLQLTQLALVAALFLHLLDIRTRTGATSAILAMSVLIGHHTFGWLLWEGVPVPAGLTTLVCCLATMAVMRRPPTGVTGAAAIALLAVALLVAETGVLLWVVIVAAWVAGFRGATWRLAVLATLVLIAYFGARAILLAEFAPSGFRRPTGWWLQTLEPDEIQRRFGDSPWVFYAYNVIGNWLSVLVAEPRRGVWVLPRAFAGGTILQPWMIVNLASSLGTTLVLAAFAWRSARRWRQYGADEFARYLVVFAAVLAANGVLLYAYMRDAALSPAGLFYALAVYPAFVWVLSEPARRSRLARAAVSAALAVLAAGWSVRVAGVSLNQREFAYRHRQDWADWPVDRDRQGAPLSAAAAAMARTLRDRALGADVPSPRLAWPQSERWADNAD